MPITTDVRISIRARCTTFCDKVCQWLATGRWFSPGLPVFSTNKTDRHDITEILLKVTLNTIKQTNKQGNKQTTNYVGILDQLLTNKYYDVLLFILINKWYEILISVWLFHSSNSWSNEELSYHVKTILITDNTLSAKLMILSFAKNALFHERLTIPSMCKHY